MKSPAVPLDESFVNLASTAKQSLPSNSERLSSTFDLLFAADMGIVAKTESFF